MSFHAYVLLCFSIGTLFSIFHDFYVQLSNKKLFDNEQVTLAVGVLSSRGNFEQREAARSTWLKDYSSTKSGVKAWFIVGNESCSVPPEYRLSIYGCERWLINTANLQENFYASEEEDSSYCSSDLEKKFFQGFSFKVNFPVVVTKLGVFSRVVREGSDVKVALMDVQNQAMIVQAVIPSNHSVVHGYIYVDVEPTLLPKNYEGLVLVEGYLKDKACADIVWNDGGGTITFKRIYSSPLHLDSKSYTPRKLSAASIKFFVPELEKLKKIAAEEFSVTKRWFVHSEELNRRLRKEITRHKDVLVVDVIDTYRNLPSKLLKFYQWLNQNYDFSFVMKTDDDSVINVQRMLGKLQTDSKFNPSRLWLWSKFRKEWPVNYVGKWTDYGYKSSYYPTFPCGAAYVMSYKVTQWLVSNSEYLHIYQGEDVSIGIWLSAINPDFIEDESFVCDRTCSANSYNQAQLGLKEIYDAWSNFENCNVFCGCIK